MEIYEGRGLDLGTNPNPETDNFNLLALKTGEAHYPD